jgi:hypothetical protein
MAEFIFQPIKVNSIAPGGACVLRTFDDVGAFILLNVGISRRKSQSWQAVRQSQAGFGARAGLIDSAAPLFSEAIRCLVELGLKAKGK